MTSVLHEQPLLPHIVIQALNLRQADTCGFTGDRVLTYAEVRDRTSQMVQAMNSVGVRQGSRLAILSKNRPEVLTNRRRRSSTGAS